MATTTVPRRRRRSSYNLRPDWMTTKRTIAALLLTLFAIGGVYGVRVVLALSSITHESPGQVLSDLIGGGSNSQVQAAQVNLQRINIAFYGYGGPGHDGAYLTDSIMVVSIQPRASGPPQVAEISVPRDWYVPIPTNNGTQHQRINFAYAAGMLNEGPVPNTQTGAGAAVANPLLEKLLGIHIDHYVGVDFGAFKEAVDSVGGVDVVVPHTFTDYQYPAGECTPTDRRGCGFITVHFNAGVTHMNGTQALEFARSRHGDNGEGSDFARSHRQQLIVAALKQKVVSIGGIGNLPSLLNALGDNVSTDLTVSDMEALYAMVKDVDPATVEHVSIDDTNFLYECGYPANCGAYYLFAHDRTLTSLHRFINSVFVDPAAFDKKAQITVEDGSGRRLGASQRWSALFGELGLTAHDGGVVKLSATTQVIDSSGGRDAATAKWLADYFGVSVITVKTAASTTDAVTSIPQSGGVTVILGADEEKQFNDLSGSAVD